MTVKECYEMFGGDYEDVLQRIPRDELVKKFVLKFLDDKSYEKLKVGLQQENMEEAFRAAHSLKGVSQNLSFQKLGQSAGELTEQLRHWESAPVDRACCEQLFQTVTADYEAVIAAIQKLG